MPDAAPHIIILTPKPKTVMGGIPILSWDDTFVWDEIMQWHGDKPTCPGGRGRGLQEKHDARGPDVEPERTAPDAHAD